MSALRNGCSATDTILDIDTALGIDAYPTAYTIESEVVNVVGGGRALSVTVQRGIGGTTAASHVNGSTLTAANAFAGGGGGVTVDNQSDPPAEVTTLIAPGAVIVGEEATLTPITTFTEPVHITVPTGSVGVQRLRVQGGDHATPDELVKFQSADEINVFEVDTDGALSIQLRGDGTRFNVQQSIDELTIDGPIFSADGYAVWITAADASLVFQASRSGAGGALGFFAATPVAQPAAVADATDAASTMARLNDLLARLRTLGLIDT